MKNVFKEIGEAISEVVPIALGVGILLGIIAMGGSLQNFILNFEKSICGMG